MNAKKKIIIAITAIAVIAAAICGGLYALSQDGVLDMKDVFSTARTVAPYFIPFVIIVILCIALTIVLGKKSKKMGFMVKRQSIFAGALVFVITVNVVCFGPMQTVLNLALATSGGLTEEIAASSKQLNIDIANEGTVLLKNEGSVLPLGTDVNKLNVFGWGSTNPCYGGTGSGSIDVSTCTSILTSLTNAGFELNTELSDFYVSYRDTRPEVGMWAQDWTLPEPTADTYSEELINNAKSFSEQALIVITRVGGEGADLPTDMSAVTYEGNPGDFEEGQTYLELSKTEKEMVEMVTSNFDDVVVVINAANSMELGWLDEYDSIKGAFWMAGAGQNGFEALGSILKGDVNPSGKLVDTYVYDLTSTPVYNNIGAFAYDNVEGSTFINYNEGIYVGYRFYETFYLNNEDEYKSNVQYPFGYGLSYTSFEQKMSDIVIDEDGNISFDVTVTNTGDAAGKDVIEVYYTAPYYEGGIEKSAVDLIDFAKTNILAPDESQTITIKFNEEDMASYDTYGEGCYVLEAGDYDISIRSDSHTVIESKAYSVGETVVYNENNTRSTDGVTATNKFASFTEGDVVYLSRANEFENYEEAIKAPSNYTMSDEVLAGFTNDSNYVPEVDENAVMPTTGAKNGLKLVDYVGLEYDDPSWDSLLDQLTVEEMHDLTALGGYQTVEVDSVRKLATVDADGPAGWSSFFNKAIKGTAFPCATMLAATWNVELATARGVAMGDEASCINVSGWYGPAMNIHRSAFSGRNFEYYSEDGVLSGVMAAGEIAGAASKGLYSYMKHFALNDQETNRCSMLCTWSNEQAIRQIYLLPFEKAVKDGGCMAAMSSFNYIGNEWAGGCAELLNDVLRGEWGFRGMVLTDYFGGYGYMDADKAIRNGNDIMLSPTGESGAIADDVESATAVDAMRTASKNIMYTIVNSSAYYDYSEGLNLQPWMKAAYGVDAVLLVILVVLELQTFKAWKKKEEN